jgi:hypothetical protein
VDRRLDDVLERGLVWEQVEALEDHADLRPSPCDRAFAVLNQLAVALSVADQVAVDLDPPGVDLLEVVHAADEGRLAGPRGPDQAHGLAPLQLERDALEHLEPTEALVHVERPNHESTDGVHRLAHGRHRAHE